MRITPEQLFEWIEETEDFTPMRYSGRAMFGDHCIAIDVDREQSAFEVVARICQVAVDSSENVSKAGELMEALARVFRGTRQDSMGLGIVIYWPDMEWPEEKNKKDPDGERGGFDDEETYRNDTDD